MARDAIEFEWKKFRKTLKDSETEISDLSLISEFRDTVSWVEENGELLKTCWPNSFMKLLRRLNDELGECRIVWQHYYNQVVTDKKNKKKNMVRFNPLSKKWWVVRTRRKSLAQIREEMFLDLGWVDRTQHWRPSSLITGTGETFQQIHSNNVIGFDDFADEIEDVLLGIRREDNKKKDDDGFIACGITGMGGVGKTELAHKVFTSPRIRQEFPIRIWVCLADYTRIDEVFQIENMLEDMRDQFRSCGGDPFVELRDGLSRCKYLIVLDGAWQDHPWFLNLHQTRQDDDQDQNYKLSYALPSHGAVLVTSRREHLVKRMVGEHSFTTRLDQQTVLLQEICCKIFQDSLGIEIFKKDEIAMKMGTNCNEIEEMLLRGETGKFTRLSTGKHESSLIEQAFNSGRIVEEFPTRIWICWSELNISYRPYAVLRHMLHELEHIPNYMFETYDEDDDSQLLKRLSWKLSICKFLIVWDCFPICYPYDKWYRDVFEGLAGVVIFNTKYEPIDYEYNSRKLDTIVLEMCFARIKDDIKYKIQGLPLAANELAPIIHKQFLQLVKESTEKDKSGAWPGVEFCVIYIH